jgi:predicted transposase/invertase (TIGR01784 family)
MKYLDPKNDLTFKKVFGQHPHLLKSFLNALLPLDEGQVIESLEYLPAELVPEIPHIKNSIVDVRCKDNYGRQFIVEMQMHWTTGFMQRVLFNASKAYVKQLDKTYEYKSLQPVYALSLVNENFEPVKKEYYHHYQIVNVADTEKRIEGLEFVFVELPKFKAQNVSEKKLQVLWLRFMTEIDEDSIEISQDLLDYSEIREALDNIQVSAFNKGELESYDKYWDSIRTEKTLQSGFYDKGKAEGRAEGRAEGITEGEQIGINKAKKELVLNAKAMGLSISEIAKLTGLSESEIESI